MKTKIIFLIGICFLFSTYSSNAQKYRTIEQYEKYFAENYYSLDKIEGIWTIFSSLNIIMSDGYTKAPSSNKMKVVIIKENNNYVEYKFVDNEYSPREFNVIFYKSNFIEYLCSWSETDITPYSTSDNFNILNNRFNYTIKLIVNKKGMKFTSIIKNTYVKIFPFESDIK